MSEDKNEDVKEAKSAQKAGNELKGLSIVGKLVGLFVMAWLISISYYAFAFFALGMLPSIVAIIADRGAGRFASKTVSACNFVGVMPFLFEIGMTYEPSIAAKQMMSQPLTWIIIYGLAMIGWMLIWVMPQITLIFFTLRADIKTKNLLEDQKRLLDEWGDEVKSGNRRR